MRIPSPRPARKVRIEIIPLIDVIFFLLATFIMVSLSMIKSQAIQVDLPPASTSVPQDRENLVAITVTESGEFFYNKEPVDLKQIGERLRVFKVEQADPGVSIYADEKADFGRAIAVLDEARRAGITKVSIKTRLKTR